MKRSKLLSALFVGLAAGGCGGEPDRGPGAEGFGEVDDPIINGLPFQPEANAAFSGVVEVRRVVNGVGFVGTGVLLRNDWVISARHLFFEQGNPPTRVPNTDVQIHAPGRLDPDPNNLSQLSGVDRVLFHRLGPRLDIALAHLDTPISTSLGASQHKLNFYQGPFSNDQAPNGPIDQLVVCFGYGRLFPGGPPTEQLMAGTSFIQSVNRTAVVDPLENRIDGSLNIFMRLTPGPALAQLPAGGDSGGPCFFGPGLMSIHTSSDPQATISHETQVDAFQPWVEQILFDIGASEFNDTGTTFTASSDVLFRFAPTGVNFALQMGTRPGGPNGQSVPVAEESIFIEPVINPVITFGGFTFQVAVRGIGQFNDDGMSDLVTTFDTNDATGQPVRFVVAYLSNGSNARTPTTLFGMTNSDGWEIASVSDLDSDGLSDILWRNVFAPGLHAASFMGRTLGGAPTMLSSFFVPLFPARDFDGNDIPGSVDPAWRLVAAGDFDRGIVGEDNRVRDLTAADLLWHNQATGGVELWSMGFRQGEYVILARFQVGPLRDPSRFEIIAFADYTQDGTPDIMWRDRQTTGIDLWFLELDPVTGNPIRTEILVELQDGSQLGLLNEFEIPGPK